MMVTSAAQAGRRGGRPRGGGGPYGGGGGGGHGGGGGGGGGHGVPCFLKGTTIKTASGQVAVEDLVVGQEIETISGELRAIKWIGNFSAEKGANGHWHRYERPIRIERGAIDEATPSRDLWVSPGHALFIDGVLISAADLVNGMTICAADPDGIDTLEYFHFELDSHDVVFANGAPAETYLELRALTADSDQQPTPAIAYAPVLRLQGGRERMASYLRSATAPLIDRRTKLELIRDRLTQRALHLRSKTISSAA
ncbi:MAG: Hint domain-containing protein [Alphaproteobacteria bacterium]|nr:Hint domain-containing protein [Alphaproteobacteria bacterium]